MSRRALLALLTAALTLAVIEGASYAFFTLAGSRFAFADPRPYTLDEERTQRLRAIYDAELGWIRRKDTPFGERRRPRDFGRGLIAAFGDSHTQGDEVGDDETWETYLAEALGADVYNFGVGGYGPDQALLRFRQKAPEVQAPVVVLGVGLENINRIVNVYRPFYAPDTGLPLTKPRFVLRGGRLELMPNPVRSAEELARLADPAFIDRIGAGDYWYSRSGLPARRFPYARLLFSRAIWTQALEQRAGRNDNLSRPLANLWKDDEARALYFAILDAFVAEAKAMGRTPVVVLQPGPAALRAFRESRGIPGHKPLLDHCRERGHACIDGITALGQDPRATSIDGLAAPGGHLTAAGNRLVADALRSTMQPLMKEHP